MNQQLIDQHFRTCQSAKSTTELEQRLAEARRELSQAEYLALVGRLSSAANAEYEQAQR